MRQTLEKIMKRYFISHLKATRKAQKLTQAKMAEQLCMDPRSYSDLERGVNTLGALTLIIYLYKFCPNPASVLGELWELFQEEKDIA